MLEGILGNKTAEKFLLHIFHYGESPASGIAKDFNTSVTPVIQQLNRFELAGVLVSKMTGRSRIYSFNPKSPFAKPVRETYVHPKCAKTIKFMYGPAGIGDDVKIKPDENRVEGQTLYIFSPTDCIRDRLASCMHFRARECLYQAVLVAEKFPFNQKKAKAWCAAQGAPQAFKEMMKKLTK